MLMHLALLFRMLKSLGLEEIPPVVYQLLILCSRGHRVSVLEGITGYFTQLDVESVQNEQQQRLVVNPANELINHSLW